MNNENTTIPPQAMTQADCFREYARVIDMYEGNTTKAKRAIKCEDVVGVNGRFESNPHDYVFPMGILEDDPVYFGNTVYGKNNKEQYVVSGYGKLHGRPILHLNHSKIPSFIDDLTWEKPKPKPVFKTDDKVLVRDTPAGKWLRKYYEKVSEAGVHLTFPSGADSWAISGPNGGVHSGVPWNYCEPYSEELEQENNR